MRKMIRKALVFFMVGCIYMNIFSFNAIAATRVNLANIGNDFSLSAVEKNAKSVKKGTYKVRIPSSGEGFLKFKAPKTAKYKIRFYKLKTKNKSKESYGFVNVYKGVRKGNYLTDKKIKTKNGSIYLQNKEVSTSVKATVKMKKGETIYLEFIFSPKDSLKMSIK